MLTWDINVIIQAIQPAESTYEQSIYQTVLVIVSVSFLLWLRLQSFIDITSILTVE